MKYLSIIPFILLFASAVLGQKELPDTVIDFNIDYLKQHVYTLADDSLEGRQAGTAGGKKAAQYIASKFEEYGLKHIQGQENYYQSFDFVRRGERNIKINAGNFQFKIGHDFYVKNDFTVKKWRAKLVFLHYGIDQSDYSDFERVNLNGKIAIMLVGKPNFEGLEGGSAQFSSAVKIKLAKSKGAAGVIFVHTSEKEFEYAAQINKIRTPSNGKLDKNIETIHGYPVFYFNDKAGERFMKRTIKGEITKSAKYFKSKKKKRPYYSTAIITANKFINHSQNVIGIIEGELKNDYIVISAHYDHLGKQRRFIYNGADDNASGVASLLELARVFSAYKKKGIRPKRSIVFIGFSAEEEGMLGSEYFINHPTISLKRTVLNINMDMIGRAKRLSRKSIFYLITNSSKTVEFHNKALENYNTEDLKFNYSLNSKKHPKQVFYRSDHYHFYEKGIPFIMYHTNDHIDYHQPTDTPRKIEYKALLKITELIFFITKYSAEHLYP